MRVKETQPRTSLTPTQSTEACQRTKAIYSNTLTDQDSSSGNLAPVHRAPPSGYTSKSTIETTGSKTFPKLYKKSLTEPWTFVKSSRLPAEKNQQSSRDPHKLLKITVTNFWNQNLVYILPTKAYKINLVWFHMSGVLGFWGQVMTCVAPLFTSRTL